MQVEELMDELASRLERGDGFIMELRVDPTGDVSATFMPIDPRPAFAQVRIAYEAMRAQVAPVWPLLQTGVAQILASAGIERKGF